MCDEHKGTRHASPITHLGQCPPAATSYARRSLPVANCFQIRYATVYYLGLLTGNLLVNAAHDVTAWKTGPDRFDNTVRKSSFPIVDQTVTNDNTL